jgi:hypothetical protein
MPSEENRPGHQWLTPIILATQEDHGSKPAWANSSQDRISRKPFRKRAGGVAHGEGPELNPIAVGGKRK